MTATHIACWDPRRAPWPTICALLAAVALLPATGCHREPAPQPAAAKTKQELKPDFEPQRLVSRPNDGIHAELLLKPGHWSSIDLDIIANHFDARGQLVTQLVDEAGSPLDVNFTPFRSQFERPVMLPKAQLRQLESSLFCPTWGAPRRAVEHMLDERDNERFATSTVVTLLPAHQWFFVVLARDPDRYRYLPDLDCVAAPDGNSLADDNVPHYRVRNLNRGRRLELAPSFQGWTSTAYVLWDDRDPTDLSPEQQQAMLDWLHWGGQLIVSGPDTLAALRGSFLEPVLPAKAGGAREINTEAFAALANLTPCEPMRLYRPYSGVELIAKPGAACPEPLQQEFQPPLVLEQRVGRGRVIVTAFGLGDRKLRDWKGLDAFYNACLLRRPKRKLIPTEGVPAVLDFASKPPLFDSLTSKVRYLSRDRGDGTLRLATGYQTMTDAFGTVLVFPQPPKADPNLLPESAKKEEAPDPSTPNVAAWNDLSPISNAARDALRAAAEIPVPPARFVFWSLALYLVALVPLNWLVFRLLGRVEWAFAAVPVLAAAGTAAVVWSTQLNVGFSRARSEIGIIEMQPGYERAHLTRYTAIYNSLGADYRLRFDDPSAVALPFFTGANVLPGQQRETASLHRLPSSADNEKHGAIELDGFQIASNSTGMLHCEAMLRAGGGLRLVPTSEGRARLENDSPWTITQPVLLSWLRALPLDTLEPGEACEVSLNEGRSLDDPKWLVQMADGLDLRKLAMTAGASLKPGQLCLLGVVAGPIAGMEIEPAAAPAHIANLVVAHLDFGPLPEPQVDVDCRPMMNPGELQE